MIDTGGGVGGQRAISAALTTLLFVISQLT